jgi:hypothetical protein
VCTPSPCSAAALLRPARSIENAVVTMSESEDADRLGGGGGELGCSPAGLEEVAVLGGVSGLGGAVGELVDVAH